MLSSSLVYLLRNLKLHIALRTDCINYRLYSCLTVNETEQIKDMTVDLEQSGTKIDLTYYP